MSTTEKHVGNFSRIVIDPLKMSGQPCIKGSRLTVRRVLEALAEFPDRELLRKEYPELADEDIQQALSYAAQDTDDQIIILTGTK